jgi:very-short-patch-repair endonuclease
VADLVGQSGAVKWAHLLRTDHVTGSVDAWACATWIEAWRWRQAATFIDAIDGRKALKALQAQRKSAETDLAHTYQRLVENKTWREVYRHSPPAVKAALQAYLNAVRAIGKGTGIRAIRHRRAARAAMLEAYRAVPCWILPQWRVSETLPPEIGKFDLVIVDEASQSDLWVLPSLLRGIKVMVVGDDKQVSPDGIGLSEERIKDLKNRFLSDQAHREQMTPEKSMYDLAKVVFAGEMVMLREHFRCVPSIIEFSKREFYNHEIQPLRVPKRTERLDPPLIDVFVRGGARADKVNAAEARAIVDEIKVIIADPACKSRSIGVVSLLGMEQAHRIFELIREEIPAEEIVGRRMTVGDARTFQGKERDIMLLSMVATPEKSVTVTARMYEQRFNVAASRARDRMYLFRSVELADLSKSDLKARLIEHFRAPFHQDPRRVSTLRELCESDFERDMFDELTNAGYRVNPQIPIGSYRIDLVVEGTEDRRLAVECDGDKYHGPERWGYDMARQRILERAGWTFWRCFGASFNRDRKGALADLFGTLKAMGIEPIGAADIDAGTYFEHRVVGLAEGLEPAPDVNPRRAAAARTGGPPARKVGQTKANNESVSETAATASLARKPQHDSQKSPTQSVIPMSGGQGKYSDDVLYEFMNRYSMLSEDNRPKGGALWVWGNASPDISRQLKVWGFQFSAKKRWWRK